MVLPRRHLIGINFVIATIITGCYSQDYDVSEIQCSFQSQAANAIDTITALLRKPAGFRGAPLFADDRTVNPSTDRQCIIEADPTDDLLFHMTVLDFSRCGVLKRNGYVHVRVWFPQFPGVVMQSDQELIIMCKPPEPTIIQNKAAGFSGSFPHGARVSGVVEENPGRLEYEVALYKEAPPAAAMINGNLPAVTPFSNKNQTQIRPSSVSGQKGELPVDQAVPIGTKLQLRARINTDSVWKHVKLLEVYVSPDPDNPHAVGSVSLVRNGCRNEDLISILPHQPAKYRDRTNEVFLDFEAFLLSSIKEKNTLWIHSQIKACVDVEDCIPDLCLDIYEPSGHGRKRRHIEHRSSTNNTDEFTRFKENIAYSVIIPGAYGDGEHGRESDQCRNIIMLSILLTIVVAICSILACAFLMSIKSKETQSMREQSSKGYSGRAIVQ